MMRLRSSRGTMLSGWKSLFCMGCFQAFSGMLCSEICADANTLAWLSALVYLRILVSSHIDCSQGTIVLERYVYSHDMIFLVFFVFLSCTRDEIFRENHDSPANRSQCTTRTITRNIYYSAPHWTWRDGRRLPVWPVATLAMPTSARSANAGSGSRKRSAFGRRASGPSSSAED